MKHTEVGEPVARPASASRWVRSRVRNTGLLATALLAAVAVAACSSTPSSSAGSEADGSPAASSPSGSADGSSGTEQPSEPASAPSSDGQNEDAKKVPFTVAWNSSPDVGYLPMLMALDSMKHDGYNIDIKQLNGAAQVVQALAVNKVQLTEDNAGDTAPASARGADVVAIAGLNNNQVVWTVAKGYEDCNKLNGKPVGVFDMSGGWTSLMKAYFAKHCPDVKPNYIITPDSSLRAQALVGGNIVATTLSLLDMKHVEAEHPDKFTTVNLGAEFPKVGGAYAFSNMATVKAHPELLQTYVEAQLTAVRSLYNDPDAFDAALKKFLPDADPEQSRAYLDGKLWLPDGGYPLGSGMQKTFELFGLHGDPSALVTNDILKPAIEKIGSANK